MALACRAQSPRWPCTRRWYEHRVRSTASADACSSRASRRLRGIDPAPGGRPEQERAAHHARRSLSANARAAFDRFSILVLVRSKSCSQVAPSWQSPRLRSLAIVPEGVRVALREVQRLGRPACGPPRADSEAPERAVRGPRSRIHRLVPQSSLPSPRASGSSALGLGLRSSRQWLRPCHAPRRSSTTCRSR